MSIYNWYVLALYIYIIYIGTKAYTFDMCLMSIYTCIYMPPNKKKHKKLQKKLKFSMSPKGKSNAQKINIKTMPLLF